MRDPNHYFRKKEDPPLRWRCTIFLLLLAPISCRTVGGRDQIPQQKIEVLGGLLTYQSEAVTGTGASSGSSLKVTGYASAGLSVGYRVRTAKTDFLVPIENSDDKKTNTIEYDHQITTVDYHIRGLTLGLARGHHNVIITKDGTPHIDSVAQGSGVHFGFQYEVRPENFLIFDFVQTIPDSTKNSVPGSSTKVEMGARQEIYFGATTPIFNQWMHLSLGVERSSFGIKIDNKTSQELQTVTSIGLLFSLPPSQ